VTPATGERQAQDEAEAKSTINNTPTYGQAYTLLDGIILFFSPYYKCIPSQRPHIACTSTYPNSIVHPKTAQHAALSPSPHRIRNRQEFTSTTPRVYFFHIIQDRDYFTRVNNPVLHEKKPLGGYRTHRYSKMGGGYLYSTGTQLHSTDFPPHVTSIVLFSSPTTRRFPPFAHLRVIGLESSHLCRILRCPGKSV